MQIAGTRTGVGRPLVEVLRALAHDHEVAGLDLVSAYWDTTAVPLALDLASTLGAGVRLVLWTAGGTRAAWEVCRARHGDAGLELRFVDSPRGHGIFHVKLAGARGADGAWGCAYVGSGNLTDAALRRNLELGVLVRRDEGPVVDLQGWFDALWKEATSAHAIDWAHAIDIAPERSEAAARRELFNAAALATPAPASDELPALRLR